MLKKENNFRVNQIVFFKSEDQVISGEVRFIRYMKDDVRDKEDHLIIRSIMNTEYFISGKWHKEAELKKSAEELL